MYEEKITNKTKKIAKQSNILVTKSLKINKFKKELRKSTNL